jgi:hypothetical protein
MSQENVEIARRWYEVATSKVQLLAAMPRTMAFAIPTSNGAHLKTEGRIGVAKGSGSGSRSGSRASMTTGTRSIGPSTGGGDEVLVEATEVGRGAISGAEVRSTHYELLRIRDGMIVRIREYYDEGNALEAAGLSE